MPVNTASMHLECVDNEMLESGINRKNTSKQG